MDDLNQFRYNKVTASCDPGNDLNIELQAEGENYRVEYPVSVSVQPNEAERMLISFFAPMSSHHRFCVRLGNVNDIELKSKIIALYTFKPKFDKSLLEGIDPFPEDDE